VDLIERDTLLSALQGRLQGVAVSGHVMLVAGEAGVGKSSLLRELAQRHAAAGGRVWWGACDALETPLPLAPLLDIARDASTRFAAQLNGPRPALFEAVLDELRLAAGPVLVVVEDAHWADEATLDLLKYLGRRIERTRALLAVSYRDDEVTATHPLRRVLGELPPAARSYLPVPRLSADAVAQLARQAGRSADGLHALTQGNAFFVTEWLRDGTAAGQVPRSVQDVVLARVAALPVPVQQLLQAVAVVPGKTERWLVDRLLAPATDTLDAALASGLLVMDGSWLAYRHELGRVAVESALSPALHEAWHARVLQVLSAATPATAAARLVHHAVQAHDVQAISRHAPEAAAEARARGALREFGAHWRVAVRQGRPRDDDERIAWLEGHVSAGSVNVWFDETLQALQTLEQLHRARGNLARAALARAQQSGPLVGLLRHEHALQACRDAVALAEGLPEGPEVAQVWGFMSWQYMLDRDYADSVAWGRRAIALAERAGDRAALERALTATGAALLFIDFDAGRHMLLDLAERRRARGDRLATAASLSMVGSGLGELMRLAEAEACLREASELLESLDAGGQYARAWRALVLLALGRWDEAGAEALHVLPRAGVDDMSALMAQLALARLRLRRGDPSADDAIAVARRLAEPSGTLQRMAPCAAVRAEAAHARGDMAEVASAVLSALPLARAKGHPWFVGELSYWLWRAGSAPPADAGCAEPWALQMAGRWREAAAAWATLGCPYEQAHALAEGDEPSQRDALAIFERLGARPAAEDLRRRLRAAGVRGLERGARASTREHPAGLTRAESEVLALMAQGLRNAEIAARIHRSVRTVDHHVAAVLSKLGVDSRQAAVQRARREGWLAPDDGAI
jgi:DNA-binding CsgD family transcriptional regulator/tetratricopeptide (TPR) repeat protein